MKEQPITSLFILGSFWKSLKCILLFFLRPSPTASTRRVCAGTYSSGADVPEGPAAPLLTHKRSWRSENTHSLSHTCTQSWWPYQPVKRAPPRLPTSPVPHSYSSTPTRFLQHDSTLYRALAWLWKDPPSPHILPSSLTLSRSLHIFLSLSGTEWGIGKPVGQWGPSRQFQWLCPKVAPKEQSQGQRWRTTRRTLQRTRLPLGSSQEEETTRRTKRCPVVRTDCLLPASNSKCASLLLELWCVTPAAFVLQMWIMPQIMWLVEETCVLLSKWLSGVNICHFSAKNQIMIPFQLQNKAFECKHLNANIFSQTKYITIVILMFCKIIIVIIIVNIVFYRTILFYYSNVFLSLFVSFNNNYNNNKIYLLIIIIIYGINLYLKNK